MFQAKGKASPLSGVRIESTSIRNEYDSDRLRMKECMCVSVRVSNTLAFSPFDSTMIGANYVG